MLAFAAAEDPANGGNGFHVINKQVDAWAAGTVCKVGNGQLVIRGAQMPVATVRARMHLEMRAKLAGVEDPLQRLKIIKQVKAEWSDKLEAALCEDTTASRMTFKTPECAKELVLLDAKSIRQLPFFQKMQNIKEARAQQGFADKDLALLYDSHEQRAAARAERAEKIEKAVEVKFDQEQREAAAEKISEGVKERVEAAREQLAPERLAATDLQVGDKVLVGYDSDDDTAFTVIRKEQPEKPKAQPDTDTENANDKDNDSDND
jgi:hypothetical protein